MATRPPWQLGPGLAAHKAAPQRSGPAACHGLREGTHRGPPAPQHRRTGIPEGFIPSFQPRGSVQGLQTLPPGWCSPSNLALDLPQMGQPQVLWAAWASASPASQEQLHPKSQSKPTLSLFFSLKPFLLVLALHALVNDHPQEPGALS